MSSLDDSYLYDENGREFLLSGQNGGHTDDEEAFAYPDPKPSRSSACVTPF